MASEPVQRQTDRLLDEAEPAIAEHLWSLARDRAQSVLAIDPENSDAIRYLAAAKRGVGG